jgi:hypothetical protein
VKLIERYNNFYNYECSGMTHGGPITMSHLQAMALECMLKTFYKQHDSDKLLVEDVKLLIEELWKQ